MNVIVNGKMFSIDNTSTSYTDVITLAGYAPHRTLSVTYRWQGEGDIMRSGILAPGQYVTPAEGMIFNAVRT